MESPFTNSQDSSEDSFTPLNLTDFIATKEKYKYPRRFTQSANNSYVSSQSDSSSQTSKPRRRNRGGKLPPLGIFWDIENCHVPKNKSTAAVVQRIREFFLENYREAEFLVVCDVKRERSQLIQDLHDSQVNLIHVSSTSKNAADEKLRQSLRRFGELHPAPSSVVLISSDINFASDLNDLRYRKKVRVILVHNANAADSLILCANEHYSYTAICEGLPREVQKTDEEAFILVSNLPTKNSTNAIKQRLNYLTDNCGGRVSHQVVEEGIAIIRFSSQDVANRAQKRIQGVDVFGSKIRAVTPALRTYTGQKVKSRDSSLSRNSTPELGSSYQNNIIKRYGYDMSNQDFMCRSMGAATASGDFTGAIPRRLRSSQDMFSSMPSRSRKNSASTDYSDDGKSQSDSSKPVDLIISNLDATLSVKEMKKSLTTILREYIMILNLNIIVHPDGNPIAHLKVINQQAAQFVISQVHRKKLGHKRIVISYANSNNLKLDQLKELVISILQEVPDNRMPLFKLIELLESRYHCTVSVSDVNKLKDICKISEDSGSRIISFTSEMKSSPPPNLSTNLMPYCTMHFPNGMPNLGWCELNTIQCPHVMIPLKVFSSKLNSLLDLHSGCMPLLSFQSCYEQEYGQALPVDTNGVPLEHLITCVANVEVKTSGPNKNIKIIKREPKAMECDGDVLKTVLPSLAPNISLLCRELVDLLKTTDKCQLSLNKFIPAYHHHFGRQCHMADYGFTKLLDLFEAISHVAQIMGDGSRKVITLTHQAQMRRFTSDLLRVLKVQPAKQIAIADFASGYEKVMNRVFNSVDYGMCTFQDLLEDLPDNVIVITQAEDKSMVIAVPKREQTTREIMRTKQFAREAVDILRHSPNYTMLFTKFVPAYHHHFGNQCRVSDYGFTKLVELFEAIPDFVRIHELSDGERAVSLTLTQSLKILGSQITSLMKNAPTCSILLHELPRIYMRGFGYSLKPEVYECDTIQDAVQKIPDYVQMVPSVMGTVLVQVEATDCSTLKIRAWSMLLKPPHRKSTTMFQFDYESRYHTELPEGYLLQLRNVISLSFINDTNYITLMSLYVLAAQIYHVLYVNGGSVLYSQLDRLYLKSFSKSLKLADYGIHSLDELHSHFDFLFSISGFHKNVLALNRGLTEYFVHLPPQAGAASFGNSQWPPPPSVTQVEKSKNNGQKMSVPKPDTPPAPNTVVWSPLSLNRAVESDLNLSIQLPIMQNPPLLGNPFDLISPARNLFPHRDLWGKPPNPADLPMPDKLMKGIWDDSQDSGVNSKLDNSPDQDIEPADCGIGVKRRLTSYLNFD